MLKILKNILSVDVYTKKEPIIRFLNKYELKSLVCIYVFIKMEAMIACVLLPLIIFCGWIF